jgi:hypothetical protein
VATPIETKIREQIDFLINTEMTAANGYNFDMADLDNPPDFGITVSGDEEKNEDDGDPERFTGIGIPENRRVMKAGLYRNTILFAIHVPFGANQDVDYAAQVADDWKRAFGKFPQVNPNAQSGAFEAQYKGYFKRYAVDETVEPNAIDFMVLVRYRQKRLSPADAG